MSLRSDGEFLEEAREENRAEEAAALARAEAAGDGCPSCGRREAEHGEEAAARCLGAFYATETIIGGLGR